LGQKFFANSSFFSELPSKNNTPLANPEHKYFFFRQPKESRRKAALSREKEKVLHSNKVLFKIFRNTSFPLTATAFPDTPPGRKKK